MLSYDALKKSFEEQFGTSGDAVFAAPGRTEVIGNHTDHQQGEVLAAAIDRETVAVTKISDDGIIRFYAAGYGLSEIDTTELSVHEDEKMTTAALIRGVAAGFRKRGYQIGGFSAYEESEVPAGSGLSSSASFESLIGIIFSEYFNEGKVSGEEIAEIGQYAENEFFGKPCGLMDQMACSVGSLCHMDFADPKKAKIARVDVNPCDLGYTLCITATGGSHADLTHEYAAVAEEMRKAAKVMGKEILCGTSMEELLAAGPEIRKQCGDRAFLRAMHYVQEVRRVETAVDALKGKDLDTFLAQVSASGNSSYRYAQNVYLGTEVENQPVSVALCVSKEILGDNGVCRIHGGGFGGTILAFVKSDVAGEYIQTMEQYFGAGNCMKMNIKNEGARRVE